MPKGSVARSFPREEAELKDLFSKGFKELRHIDTQQASTKSLHQPAAAAAPKQRGDTAVAQAKHAVVKAIKAGKAPEQAVDEAIRRVVAGSSQLAAGAAAPKVL